MPEKDKLLELGLVAKPHGIKGEVSLDWHGEISPARGMKIYLQKKGGIPEPFIIESVRFHKSRPLVFFSEINSRTLAEEFKGAGIFVSRDDLPVLANDEAYLADIIGCEAKLASGQSIGKIDHVEFPAGQEIWVIIDRSGNEVLFPAQSEFIEDINLESRMVTLNPPAGLLEIYSSRVKDKENA